MPRAGLRPPLHPPREPRHRDGDRPDERRRSRCRRRRRAGRRRPVDQGHLDRADVRQPDGGGREPGRRGQARGDADGRARLQDLLGQRLRAAPPDRGGGQERRHPHPGLGGGPPAPADHVRVDVEDHLRRCGRRLPGRVDGQRRVVPRPPGERLHRPRQGQPPAPRRVLRLPAGRARPHGQAPRHHRSEVRGGGPGAHRAAGRSRRRDVEHAVRWLLRQSRRRARHGVAGRGARQGGWHRADTGRVVVPLQAGPGRHQHPARPDHAARSPRSPRRWRPWPPACCWRQQSRRPPDLRRPRAPHRDRHGPGRRTCHRGAAAPRGCRARRRDRGGAPRSGRRCGPSRAGGRW